MIDASVFAGDPPLRPDGLCVVCLKPRYPERSRKYAADVAAADPFCSMLCAREWHRNPLPDNSLGRPPHLKELKERPRG